LTSNDAVLNRIIRFSLANRVIVLWLTGAVVLLGAVLFERLDVDVFPDLNRPTVTIFAEAPGLATEEVESLVAFPLETAINGATHVERVRSVSTAGLSLVFVEFAWGSDIYLDRQIVNERVQLAGSRLPAGVVPVLGPISSLMGEIMLVGLESDTGATAPPDIRSLADWVIRPRLLGVPGVSQVTAIGGGVKQLQVLVQPDKLQQYALSLHDVAAAVTASNLNTS
jgi:Cu/Ag efflux pump CusA